MPHKTSLDTYLAGDETTHPAEVVHGIVREPPAPAWGHQVVVGRLYTKIEHHVRRFGLGRVVQAPIDVVLEREPALVVQPDIVFVAAARLGICDERVWGPPDLVVEVLSSSSRRHDRVVKIGWFQRYGVPECWLVDPVSCEIEVVSLTPSTRASRVFGRPDRVRSAVLPQLRLRVLDVFADSV